VAFLERGCAVWATERWEYVSGADDRWDAWHQEVYRNHRAQRRGPDDLARLGVPTPPPAPPIGSVPPTPPPQLRASAVPDAVRRRLGGAPRTVFVLFEEDEYESCFGDGVFLYARAAFWEGDAARARLRELEASRPPEGLWYRFSIAEVALELDERHGALGSVLSLPPYARCRLDELVELLARADG
jgi:hypothetical protein